MRVAVMVGIVASVAIVDPRLASADACEGTVVADDGWGTNSPSVRVSIRYSFDSLVGEPVVQLDPLWELVGAIAVDAADVMLEELATGERAEITMSELTAELKLGSCSKHLWNGNIGVFKSEGEWGWDAGGSPGWGKLFDNCDAAGAKAAVKACSGAQLELTSVKLGLPAPLTSRMQKKHKGEAGAKEALAHDQFGEAIRHADSALEADPESAAAKDLRDRATAQLEAAIESGEAFMVSGNYEAAVTAFAAALVASKGAPTYESMIQELLDAAAKARLDASLGNGGTTDAGGGDDTGGGAQIGTTGTSCTGVDNGNNTSTITCSNGDVIFVPDTLSAEYQYAKAVDDMHRAAEELGAAFARSSPREKRMMGLLVGPAAVVWGASVLAEGVAADGFSKGQAIGHMGVYIGPSLLFLGMSAFSNGKTRTHFNERVPSWIAEARVRCEAGSLVHCQEATRLSLQLHDMNLRAGERSDASGLWGPGPKTGPRFGFYSMVGVSQASLEDDDLAGTLTGMSTQFRFRTSLLRLGLGFESRFGDVDPTGEVEGAWSFFGAAGVQVGAGLLSPYAELRLGISGAAGDNEDAAPSPDIDDELDFGVAVGNTFHFQNFFSTRGPFHLGLFADTAVTLPFAGSLGVGWQLTGGLSAYQPEMPHDRIRRLGEIPRPVVTRFDHVFVYGFVSGLGIEVARANGLRRKTESPTAQADRLARDPRSAPPSDPRFLVSAVDFYLRIRDGFGGFGAALGTLGQRFRIGPDWEVGAAFALLGADDRRERPVPDLIDYTIGVLPTRLYVRRNLPAIAFELGVRSPLFWVRPGDGETTAGTKLYAGFPGFVYAGVAL